jgi:hypothetical protein
MAEQVTVVVPILKVDPEAGLQDVLIAPSTKSVAEEVKVTAAPPAPVASAVIGAGTVTTGGVVSWTVIEKLPLLVLPAASVAEQVTAVVSSGKVLPEGREQVTGCDPSTLSVAEALYVTAAPAAPVASAVISPGSWSTGAALSFTSMVKVDVLVLFRVSVEVQVTVVCPTANVLPDAGAQLTGRDPSTASFAVGLV